MWLISFDMSNETKQEDYLKNRLEDQIDWYNKKSSKNQKMYKGLQLVSIVVAVCIPFFSLLDPPFLKYVVGAMGVLLAVFTAMTSLYKYQENWIAYRTASESLIKEKFLFTTGTAPYNRENPFNLLVERVEGLLSQENSSWAELTKNKEESEVNKNKD